MTYQKDEAAMAEVRQAIMDLWASEPYLGAVALGAQVRLTNEFATAATNGKELVVNPTWFHELERTARMVVIAHEACHPLLGHCNSRHKGKDPEHWGTASDMAIRELICQLPGFHLLEHIHLDPARNGWPRGLDAETYYDRLTREKPPEQPNQDPEDKQDGNTGEAGSPGNAPADAGNAPETADQDGAGGNTPPDAPNGPTAPQEDQPMAGDVLINEEETPEAGDVERDIINRRATEICEQAGRHVPGWAKEMSEAPVRMAPVDYRKELRQFLSVKAKVKRTFERPHRRQQAGAGLVTPIRSGKSLGRVAVAVDTSGSMRADTLQAVLGEIDKLLAQFPGTTVVMIECDSAVRRVTEFTVRDCPLAQRKVEWAGRGGTRFQPAFEEASRRRADVVVYLTDGFGDMEFRHPQVPVLWLMTTVRKAPFGKTVRVVM